jgi:hypothetical protein
MSSIDARERTSEIIKAFFEANPDTRKWFAYKYESGEPLYNTITRIVIEMRIKGYALPDETRDVWDNRFCTIIANWPAQEDE